MEDDQQRRDLGADLRRRNLELYRLFISRDRGENWEATSDLPTQTDRDKLFPRLNKLRIENNVPYIAPIERIKMD